MINKHRFVTNDGPLASHGEQALRRLAIDIIEHALAAADPSRAARERMSRDGDTLIVDGERLPLPSRGKVLFIGAGKASYPIARAVEEVLGDRLDGGLVICKYGQQGTLARIRLVHAAHPIPDEAGARATSEIVEMLKHTTADDLVIAGITGGSSALMGLPMAPVPLEEFAALTGLLLGCGANVIEINAVRKHVTAVGGGKLAELIHPRAALLNLTVSDVIGDPLDYITDPTVPDTSTLADARETLSRYELWKRIPAGIADFLREGGPARETPKQARAGYCRNLLLLSASASCDGAARRGVELGLKPMILSTRFEGESQHLGGTFAAIALEVAQSSRPIGAPALLIGGGETIVRLGNGPVGSGGPNQEFAAAAAVALDGIGNMLIAGLDSDGTDGPCDIAGAMVDGGCMSRARLLGIDLRRELSNHNISNALTRLDDIILTGATGTNVNDLKFAIVGPPQ
jgi:glycerate-2-kinase